MLCNAAQSKILLSDKSGKLAVTQQTIKSRRNAIKLMAITVSIHVTGVAATYFLECRIDLVDRLLVLLVNDIEFNPAEGLLYISHTRTHTHTHRGVVSTVNPANGLIENIIGGLSSIGVHHNNQFAFGHDGRRYTLLHQQHDLASWMDVSLVVKCRTRLIQWKHPLDIYAYIILIYPFG